MFVKFWIGGWWWSKLLFNNTKRQISQFRLKKKAVTDKRHVQIQKKSMTDKIHQDTPTIENNKIIQLF